MPAYPRDGGSYGQAEREVKGVWKGELASNYLLAERAGIVSHIFGARLLKLESDAAKAAVGRNRQGYAREDWQSLANTTAIITDCPSFDLVDSVYIMEEEVILSPLNR
jgi:hypothetical protein